METTPDNQPEIPNELHTTILQALDSGIDANMLIKAIEEEAAKRTIKEDELAQTKIQDELKMFIDSNKVTLSTPEDFEQLRKEERERWGDKEYTEGQVNHFFSYWEQAPVGKAFLQSSDKKQVTMLYKGSDGNLHMVEFDLDKLIINGKKVDRDGLHALLDHYSPFKTVVKEFDFHGNPRGSHDNRDFMKFVEQLYWVCKGRQTKESDRIADETRQALLKKFDI
jgi:hypothetical protein